MNQTQLRHALSGRYAIERELGSGGMATVYLARDERHDRHVAIKVLHEDLGATLGPERFLAEIKTTARLQHPHILPLLDSGAAGGLLYYVMPFVEGETLRARLMRDTQLPIEDAVRIAREVADALGHAHGHGIVHRDIKPENILLQGGHALVADFGIALAVQHAGGTRLTQTGLSLGTPQYMSPEQAMGEKTVGPAADLYALGAVTYEMLTGEPPFTGATVQAIVAKVLSSEPARPTMLRKTVPLHVEAAVLKALAKIPADRFPGAAQFAEALTKPTAEGFVAPGSAHPGRSSAATKRSERWWPGIATAMLLLAIVSSVVAVRATRAAHLTMSLKQYDVVLPDSAPIALDGSTALAIAPGGEYVVYIARRGETNELWYRSLVDTIARPLPGTKGALYLALSPDGGSVAFIAENRVRLASLAGEAVRELGTVRRPEGITWRTNDRVLVGDSDLGLMEFDRLGGQSAQLDEGDCPSTWVVSERAVLCDNRLVDLEADSVISLTVAGSGRSTDSRIALSGRSSEMIDREHVIYSAPDGSVIGARWSPETGIVRQRTVIHSGIRVEGVYGYRQAAISTSGALAYVPGSFNGSGHFVRNDGTRPTQLPIEPMTAAQFDVSPDGRRLAVVKVAVDGNELWVHDMLTGEGFQWARAAVLADPRWSPDSRRIVVGTLDPPGPPATIVISQERVGAPDTLHGVVVNPSHWFNERRILASTDPNAVPQLVWVELTDTGTVRADTVRSTRAEQRGVVSPDGRLFAYVAADEIAVEVVGGGGRSIVGRGIDPLWLDARTLVIRAGLGVWSRVRLNAEASPTSRPQRWFSDPRFVDTNLRSNAITPSGELVYVQGSGRTTSSFIRVVPKWADQVRAAVASAER